VLLAYDDFNYGHVGGDLTGSSGDGSFGFSGAWTGQTSYNISNGSLTSPRDPLPGGGNSVTAVAFPENRDIVRYFSAPLGTENTSIYMSVLMRPEGILGQGAYGGWFATVLRGSTDVVVGMSYGGSNYGLEVAGTKKLTNRAAVINRTEFFVLRIDFTEGVDPAYLYVNPQPGASEPSVVNAQEINLGISFLDRATLSGPGGSAYDSLRVGTTYADVAPPIADFNLSGTVDDADLSIFRTGFGTASGATLAQGDANRDGAINGADFLIWQRQVGAMYTVPSASTAAVAVPEPTGLGQLAVLALAFLVRRCRPTRQ
jgi:hypothetical protein